ncbi:PadR family transcriptional regulator [Galbitalea sp. SE-J8]|uniref:PadR family transcriptional regulator n=1 Tax=Galbitalea sp. SE-J8 TaxID=3054952 RepID=UPI00259D1AFD|nr:PadR family transcriptional regulator [Galbitalea sp. SE-J8]MDM4764160.1 PadR family transcriptional regulator [Galbitalea sp. SE-J8]
MSSIRLYILSTLAERGPQHGHALRGIAEQEHVDEWTDITPGALYGALKRMLAEGLVAVERTEREGNYPERQVYRITDAGDAAVTRIRADIFATVAVRPDPFDLALSSPDPARVDDLGADLRERRDALQRLLDEKTEHIASIEQYLWLAERLTLRHALRRIESEIAWHDDLLSQVPEIIADEKERRRRKGQKS